MADVNRQKLVLKFESADKWRSTAFLTTQSNPDPGLGTLAAYSSAVAAASAAGLVYVERQPVLLVNGATSASAYASVRDRAAIELRAADGTTGRIVIPAPLEELFLSDGERVDFANVKVLAVLTAAFANLCSPSGSPWVTATSGKRTRINWKR